VAKKLELVAMEKDTVAKKLEMFGNGKGYGGKKTRNGG
jgi:hypothetical protein